MKNQRDKVMHRYEIIIFWSNEEGIFVADLPNFTSCNAHGNIPQEALSHAQKP